MRLAIVSAIAAASVLSATGAASAASFSGVIVGKDGQVRQSRGVLAVLAHDKGKTYLTFTADYSGGGEALFYMPVPAGMKLVEAPGNALFLEKIGILATPSLLQAPANPCVYGQNLVDEYQPVLSCKPFRKDIFENRYLPAPLGIPSAQAVAESFIPDFGSIARLDDAALFHGSLPPEKARRLLARSAGRGMALLAFELHVTEVKDGYASTPPITIEYSDPGFEFSFRLAGAANPFEVTLIFLSESGSIKAAGRAMAQLPSFERIPAIARSRFQEFYRKYAMNASKGGVLEDQFSSVVLEKCPSGPDYMEILKRLGASWIEGKDRLYVTRLHYFDNGSPGAGAMKFIKAKGGYQSLGMFLLFPPYSSPIFCRRGDGYMEKYLTEEREAAKMFSSIIPMEDVEKELAQTSRLSAIFNAAFKNDLPAVQKAFSQGASLQTKSGDGMNLMGAAAMGGAMDVMNWLFEQGAGVNEGVVTSFCCHKKLRTPLMLAVSFNRMEAIKEFLKRGADVNASDEYGFTPLILAARNTNLETLKLLVANGADVSRKTKNGVSALGTISDNSGLDEGAMVIFLIKSGLKPDFSEENEGQTLADIALHGHTEAVELMLQTGANFDPASKYASRALRNAIEHGHNQVADILRAHGVSLREDDERR